VTNVTKLGPGDLIGTCRTVAILSKMTRSGGQASQEMALRRLQRVEKLDRSGLHIIETVN